MQTMWSNMSFAIFAHKKPIRSTNAMLPEPANGHKLPSFQPTRRLAGLLVATRATSPEQLAGLLRIGSALQEQIALPGTPVRETRIARPLEKEDGPHRVVGARIDVAKKRARGWIAQIARARGEPIRPIELSIPERERRQIRAGADAALVTGLRQEAFRARG